MPKYGIQFSATDGLAKASGMSHDAGERLYRNFFNLATDGGTNEALKIAHLPSSVVVDELRIETDANLSGVNFKIGTATDDDKYGTAVAGPNATTQILYPLLSLGLADTPEPEEIFLTPSGNLPSSGSIRTTLKASKR